MKILLATFPRHSDYVKTRKHNDRSVRWGSCVHSTGTNTNQMSRTVNTSLYLTRRSTKGGQDFLLLLLLLSFFSFPFLTILFPSPENSYFRFLEFATTVRATRANLCRISAVIPATRGIYTGRVATPPQLATPRGTRERTNRHPRSAPSTDHVLSPHQDGLRPMFDSKLCKQRGVTTGGRDFEGGR